MDLVIATPTAGGLSGGSRKYLEEMLPRLAQHPGVGSLRALVPYQYVNYFARLLPDKVWPVEPWFAWKWQGPRGLSDATPPCAPHNNTLNLSQQPADIVLVASAVLLGRLHAPQVVMMRNMEPPLIPFLANPIREAFKNLIRSYIARRACQRAAGVVAVSRFVESFLVNNWSLPPDTVTTIYHGVSSPDTVLSPIEYHVPLPERSYILVAGSIRPARGLEDAIKAVAKLTEQGIGMQLVIAGAVDSGMESYHRRLLHLIQGLRIATRVDWLGCLSREHIYAWMRHSLAVVVTSRAEACPNTVLEAMACGCTVVSTDFPVMRELLGDVALYYSPGEHSQLVERLRRVWAESDSVRGQRGQLAKQRAAQFTWQRTTDQTIEFLHRICQQHLRSRNRIGLHQRRTSGRIQAA